MGFWFGLCVGFGWLRAREGGVGFFCCCGGFGGFVGFLFVCGVLFCFFGGLGLVVFLVAVFS